MDDSKQHGTFAAGAAASPTFDPRRFRSNVPYYARYRLGYPDALIARVSTALGLKPGDPVMDLGAGPGLLAVPFAKSGMSVTAVDPEPEMLAALKAAADDAHVAIDIRQGSSFDMSQGIGPFRLVAMGRSFHWMDRLETLRLLDGLVTRDGGLALFHDRHPRTVENRWEGALEEVAVAYGHTDWRKRGQQPDYRTHDSVLMDSAFSELESVGVYIRRTLSADEIVGRAFSLSLLSPEKLGARAGQFERDLRGALATLSPDGQFIEIAEMTALIARRP